MRVALLLAAICLTTACARGTGGPETDPRTAVTTVRVENQSYLDMNIYVLRGLERIRLGTVTGSSTQVLTIPKYVATSPMGMRFLADPIGGRRTPVSEEITVVPGDQVTLTIPPS
jgi:hypothetical protein